MDGNAQVSSCETVSPDDSVGGNVQVSSDKSHELWRESGIVGEIGGDAVASAWRPSRLSSSIRLAMTRTKLDESLD